ncbi:hypothetical protein GUITHDRAFT_151563 [Guillardia theta CCMP2712]|uniref:MORN repeat-containing protein 5 n=2 Tax=Guillardia theta TaxID=55529 RepID=L1JMR6_GUITC|nr:hypothetical protein GUITHDRAFT_151563 [Guillardia theta CCMP2712]EKX49490.1 hypothetical protein GUITHDRAFT_151563 [Guillardia theta CCMP2712]|eukprot:XP_005836470.1 hypothetical protein GUITHDRAFT_151563 [Guillardia theta CCMP2712]
MKNGYGVYTWSEGTRWEGEWVDGKPIRGFVSFADGVRTDEVKPRENQQLSNDMTLQCLHDDAKQWKERYDAEHGIISSLLEAPAAAPRLTTPVGTADEDHDGSFVDPTAQTDQMLDQPAALIHGQTHGPTVAGAVEDFSMGDEMPEANMECSSGEPSNEIPCGEEGGWEERACPAQPGQQSHQYGES